MLTTDERAAVQAALVRLLTTKDRPREFLATVVFPTQTDRVPGQLGDRTGAAELADGTLIVCLRDRWALAPSLLEILVHYLVESQGEGALQPILARVRGGIDPNPNPFSDMWLVTKRPFFDRSALRLRLEALVTDVASPILRVRAPKDAFGRSYGRSFVEHVASRSVDGTKVIGTAISSGSGPTYDVTDLALDLVAPLGITDEPPARSDSFYPRVIARFVLARLVARPNRWIIFLDGFGQPHVKTEVREAVEVLASLIANEGYRDRVKLILVDYPGDLPNVSAMDVLEEELTPASKIVGADLQPAVAAIGKLRASEGRPELVEADLPVVLQKIVDAAPPHGKERLEAFNTALTRIWTFEADPTP